MLFIIGYKIEPTVKFCHFADMNAALDSKKYLLMALHRTEHKNQIERLLRQLNMKNADHEAIYSQICQLSERIFFRTNSKLVAKLFGNRVTAAQYKHFYGENELYTPAAAKMIWDNPAQWPQPKKSLTIELDPEEPTRPIKTVDMNSAGLVEFETWPKNGLPSCGGLPSPSRDSPPKFVFPGEMGV